MEKNKEQELEIVEAEVVEETSNEEVIEETSVEENSVEVIEETPVEENPVEVIEEPVPEEVEVIEHEVDITIEEETYVEYFKGVAFKAQVKPTLFFGVAIVLLSYFFRAEDVSATESLLNGLLWGVVFIVASLGISFFTMPSRAKSTYRKSGVQGLVLHTKFSNLGITQSIEDQSILYKWSDIDQFVTSDISYFGHMLRLKKIILMSKKNLTLEDIQKIDEIIVEHLGPNKLVPLNKNK